MFKLNTAFIFIDLSSLKKCVQLVILTLTPLQLSPTEKTKQQDLIMKNIF